MGEPPTKVCFKCKRELPIDNFYKHPQMADGHLNKCKECAKHDVHEKYMENIESPEYVEKERARGRDKWNRLYKGTKHVAAHHVENARRFIERRIGPIPEDKEIHHWNYNFMHKVFLLDRRHHARLHNLIEFDQASQCFTHNGRLLATKEEHEEILKSAMPEAQYQYLDY